jgi:hypothetical protein
MYQRIYDGEEPPKLPKRKTAGEIGWGNSGKDAHWLAKFRRLLSLIKKSDRNLLMSMARKMVK